MIAGVTNMAATVAEYCWNLLWPRPLAKSPAYVIQSMTDAPLGIETELNSAFM